MNIRLALALAPLSLALGGCGALGQYAQSAGGLNAAGQQPTAATQAAGANPTAATPAAAAKNAGDPSEAQLPGTVSVNIKNGCGKSAKVFFGKKPKFGSGTYSTVGSNVRTRHTFKVGDLFWIVDDSQNGVASVEIQSGTREIEIGGSCDSLSAK